MSIELRLRTEQIERQCVDLRALIGLLARRVTILEARPIVGLKITEDVPRVYDGSLIQEFNDLYAKGEADEHICQGRT